jgi:hypothetical protein
MVAADLQSAPVYVQQTFLWSDTPKTIGKEVSTQGNRAADLPAIVQRTTVRPSVRPPATVPTVRSTTSVRRGRCEHVGGILASVLEKYGLGIDDLIAEIDSSSR